MGVGENHGGHVRPPDAGHLQAGQNRARSVRRVAHPGIGQHNFAPGLDQEAGVRADDLVAVRTSAGEGFVKLHPIGIGKIPGRGIRDVPIAQDGTPQRADLEAMRTRRHIGDRDNCIRDFEPCLS